MDFNIPEWLHHGPDILVAPCTEQFRSALVTTAKNCICPEPTPAPSCLTLQQCLTHNTINLYVLAGHVLIIFGSLILLHYLEHRESAKRPNTRALRYAPTLQD